MTRAFEALIYNFYYNWYKKRQLQTSFNENIILCTFQTQIPKIEEFKTEDVCSV
jgi:hypothetical protein